jgi:hypothetical protein
MKGSEMMDQMLGEENYKRLKQSRTELVEAATKAGADEARDYYLKEADYVSLLLISRLVTDEDGRYPELWNITGYDMDTTSDDYPEEIQRYFEHGFVEHIRCVVALMEAQEVMEHSADLMARFDGPNRGRVRG